MSQSCSNNDDTKRRKVASLPAATRCHEDNQEPNQQDNQRPAQGEYIQFSKDIQKLKEEMIDIVSTVCLLVPVSIFTQLSDLTQVYLLY